MLIELGRMKINARHGVASFYNKHIILFEIRNVHSTTAIEANAITNASGGKRRKELGLRGLRGDPTDRPILSKIHNVQIAGCVDSRALDMSSILARRSNLTTLKQDFRARAHDALFRPECESGLPGEPRRRSGTTAASLLDHERIQVDSYSRISLGFASRPISRARVRCSKHGVPGRRWHVRAQNKSSAVRDRHALCVMQLAV